MSESHLGHCPRCTGDKLHKSRRRGFFERSILQFTNWRPYRCVGCGYRYYRNVRSLERHEVFQGMHEKGAH
jgi:hypothetical protein